MRHQRPLPLSMAFAMLALIGLSSLPVLSEEFPDESYIPLNPTLPNSKLNFNDDSNESCCVRDYVKPGSREYEVYSRIPQGTASVQATTQRAGTPAASEFEKSNPRYFENSAPIHIVACDRFGNYPELAANGTPDLQSALGQSRTNLPVTSYSTNVSIRHAAHFFTDPAMRNTSDFHIEAAGGSGVVRLKDVNSYSVCMARGNNVALVMNTDNGSIITYNGNDHIYLAGNNTNMLSRTGAGNDMIEIHQGQALPGDTPESETWLAYNIYKTALSGGTGDDTVVIKSTPKGTKWCHIGAYKIHGEYFYVVEFALPPSVKEGPRRQRINIGHSVEYVVFKGRRYTLNDFLTHGSPMDSVAQSVPVGAPLPRVNIAGR